MKLLIHNDIMVNLLKKDVFIIFFWKYNEKKNGSTAFRQLEVKNGKA